MKDIPAYIKRYIIDSDGTIDIQKLDIMKSFIDRLILMKQNPEKRSEIYEITSKVFAYQLRCKDKFNEMRSIFGQYKDQLLKDLT